MTLAETTPETAWCTEHGVQVALERWLAHDEHTGGRIPLLEVAGFSEDVQPRREFSEVLRRSLQLRQKHPFDVVGIGLPDVPRYRSLVTGSEVTLRSLRIDAYFVRPDGTVDTHQIEAHQDD